MTEYSFNNDSWIVRCEYNSDTKEMLVHTKAKVYALIAVPQEVYDGFASAGSKGAYFNQFLKGKYIDRLFKP